MKSTPTLKAGLARTDITPPLGTLLFGYSFERPGNVVADPLAATALALQYGDTAAMLISLDWCVVDEEETSEIRAAVSAATGIPARHVTVCATHTHSGPATVECWGWSVRNQEYLDTIRPSIVEAATSAQAAQRPVRVGVGTVQTDTGVNRREVDINGEVGLGFQEWGPRDRDLTVVRFEGETEPVAQLVHLCAHPTSRYLEPSISRDWPGVMIDRIEFTTGTPCIFINGAFGDVAPRTTPPAFVGDGNIGAQEVGLRAAYDAHQAWGSIKEFHDVSLGIELGELELPHAPLESLELANETIARLENEPHIYGLDGCNYQYAVAVRDAHATTPVPSRAFAQTVTRIGDVVLVPFGGEIFSEIALRLKKLSPYAYTLCAGTSNGCHGYYVTREARARGGYEVWVARAYGAYLLAENIDDVLVRLNLELLRQHFNGL